MGGKFFSGGKHVYLCFCGETTSFGGGIRQSLNKIIFCKCDNMFLMMLGFISAICMNILDSGRLISVLLFVLYIVMIMRYSYWIYIFEWKQFLQTLALF